MLFGMKVQSNRCKNKNSIMLKQQIYKLDLQGKNPFGVHCEKS